jgi:putative ABC transport system ATP-binding protein
MNMMRADTETVIEVNSVGKVVPNSADGTQALRILHEISFAVAAGESVAIVGASGSGKSTLLGLMAGLDTPSSGTIKLAGCDIGPLSEDERAALRGRVLGFVFQSFQLLPALTALENALLPLELAGTLSAHEARASAQQMLARVGLAERLNHYPKHLSGGEQQRVALARAFASRPQLLLADEPTGNLDQTTGAAVIDLMFEMNHEAGTTLVLVTHDDRLAGRCDRIVRLAGGRLV